MGERITVVKLSELREEDHEERQEDILVGKQLIVVPPNAKIYRY